MKLSKCFIYILIFCIRLGYGYLFSVCRTRFSGFLHSRTYQVLNTLSNGYCSAIDDHLGLGLGCNHRYKGDSIFVIRSLSPPEESLGASSSVGGSGFTGDDTLSELRRVLRERHGSEYPLREYYIKGTGPGGQKVNKSSNCVQLIRYSPALGVNVVIKCHKHRSLLDNRIEATRILLRRLDEAVTAQSRALRQVEEKSKRRILKLTDAEKARKKFEKQLRSEKKSIRRRWKVEEEY